MESYLGYEPNSREKKETTNRRNGYFDKTLKTSMGETTIEVPRDRQASFNSIILPKHKCDVSDIENKVLAMYACDMSQRDISTTIDYIYGFKLSAEQISKITNYVLEEQESWQNRTLAPFYPFLFIYCLFVPFTTGIRVDERKEILGIWIQDSESKHAWMQIFDELKSRSVQEVGFISMDGVSGLEEGARAIFPEVVMQRCIVHLIRKLLKYVPTKNYKDFTVH